MSNDVFLGEGVLHPLLESLEKQGAPMEFLDEDGELVDEDGMRWVKTVGTGLMKSCAPEEQVEFKSASSGGRFQTLSRSHHKKLERAYGQKPAPELSALEAQLEEVKALYKQKHGEDVDL